MQKEYKYLDTSMTVLGDGVGFLLFWSVGFGGTPLLLLFTEGETPIFLWAFVIIGGIVFVSAIKSLFARIEEKKVAAIVTKQQPYDAYVVGMSEEVDPVVRNGVTTTHRIIHLESHFGTGSLRTNLSRSGAMLVDRYILDVADGKVERKTVPCYFYDDKVWVKSHDLISTLNNIHSTKSDCDQHHGF